MTYFHADPSGRITSRLVGTTGHEIMFDDKVVAWASDGVWAAIIVKALLSSAIVINDGEDR